MKKFNELIDNPKILRGVEAIGYDTPTEIQERAIPIILEGRDVIAKSNTGTGKTASFGLPLLQRLYEGEIDQVLIVCPTRELVIQVEGELRKYSKYTDSIKIASVYGGTPIQQQIRTIKKGVKIVVGTPGRILDHVKRKTLKLEECDCLVLDEADEMLNMGFREDIEKILNEIKADHQTVLFSATLPKPIRDIAQNYLTDQVEIEVKAQYKTVETIDQVYYEVKRRPEKISAIKRILTYYSPNLTLIFCNMKSSVDELVDELNKGGIKAVGLHGDIRQEKRTRIMASFKTAKQAILVASDVAARGIDVNNIDLVVNYDLPQDNEVYVHRIGRTGRAGKNGLAITLVQGRRQQERLESITLFTKADIQKHILPTEKDMEKKHNLLLIEHLKNKMNQEGVVKEHKAFMKELLDEGYTYPAMVSGLLSIMKAGENSATENKKKKIEEGVELKISFETEIKLSKEEMKKAVIANGKIKDEQIGSISIKKYYSIVTVERKVAKKVINEMNKSKVKNNLCKVTFYKK